MINGDKISYEDSGLSKREWNELMEVIDKKNLMVS
jgi:thymidylate synthase (FAD)